MEVLTNGGYLVYPGSEDEQLDISCDAIEEEGVGRSIIEVYESDPEEAPPVEVDNDYKRKLHDMLEMTKKNGNASVVITVVTFNRLTILDHFIVRTAHHGITFSCLYTRRNMVPLLDKIWFKYSNYKGGDINTDI